MAAASGSGDGDLYLTFVLPELDSDPRLVFTTGMSIYGLIGNSHDRRVSLSAFVDFFHRILTLIEAETCVALLIGGFLRRISKTRAYNFQVCLSLILIIESISKFKVILKRQELKPKCLGTRIIQSSCGNEQNQISNRN